MAGGAADQDKLGRALERVTRMALRYEQNSEFRLQPDGPARRHVLRGLAKNMVRYGRPYCPCREVTGDPDADRRNICPCRTHPEEVERTGECECGLFVADT
jgi:ferredoxin-thioredoxin reductase catalytic subunit